MIEIKNGRIYFYNVLKPDLKVLDFKCLSAYVCPACKNVLRAYFVGYILPESLKEYMEKDSMKYAYEMGNIQGAQWMAIRDHSHKDVCRWEIIGANSRGIEHSVDSFLKIHDVALKDKKALADAIEAVSMPGFRKVPDDIGAYLAILLYDQDELVDSSKVSFDEKWERIKNLGSYMESKLQAIKADL